MSNRVKVTKSDPPETKEILAESVVRLGEAVKKLEESKLNERAIVVLLQDATGLTKGTIRTVLKAIPQLRAWYVRRP